MSDLQTQSQRTAAARAGFSERTARRFDADPTLPSNRKIAHGRTVADPLAGYWEADLPAFAGEGQRPSGRHPVAHLQTLHPLAFPDDRIRRTLERRIRQWRAQNGPERDIIFRQSPEPGYMAQLYAKSGLRKIGPTQNGADAKWGRRKMGPTLPMPTIWG